MARNKFYFTYLLT